MGRISDKNKITDFFASNVFTKEVMKNYISEEKYQEFQDIVENNKPLSLEVANSVAVAMKDWASSRGATHYTHWFQPLTGATAEKHEAFISVDKKGNTILEFTGKNLSKGETDASSFPSGGIRATFEARGYTIWDSSSPAFLKSTPGGALVLYIPTAFCSYNGEALDEKTPLLRSMDAINKSTLNLISLLGIQSKRVHSNVGAEQEYFLIDKEDYKKRADLKFCGRTLFGAKPTKDQEHSAQYYGAIKDRVGRFMADVNEELWMMGITAKTEHNEVAPSQHELVPIFTTSNIATDQNQLIMETLKNVASRHNLVCLLHEKPFKGLNGSGKHNNWSLNTVEGIKLFSPGDEPSKNLVFLLLLTAVISGVDEYSDLIRASAASPGNDERLGGDEAPPTIISVYIGDEIEKLFNAIESGKNLKDIQSKVEIMNSELKTLAGISKDTSDRNRTAPFAFTGNRFEFRMVGSSASLAFSTTVLNTITAEMVERISQELEEKVKKGIDLTRASYEIIKKLYKRHKRIIFKGNNYSDDWVKESKKRGLENITNSVDAYEVLLRNKNIELFEKNKVFSEEELKSRREIHLERYVKTIVTELKTMIRITEREIMPAALNYQKELATIVVAARKVDASSSETANSLYINISGLINSIEETKEEIKRSYERFLKLKDIKKKAIILRDQIKKKLFVLREHCDKLETIMPKKLWPMPTYEDILYYE